MTLDRPALARYLRPIAALGCAVLGLACSTPCEEFYSTYEECGFGTPDDSEIDACNQAAEADEDCENSYNRINLCIGELDDECSYPGDCGGDIQLAALTCGY